MQVILPDIEDRATLRLDDRVIDDAEFFDLCAANPDVFLERSAEGELEFVPPAGFETEFRNTRIIEHLSRWSRSDGRGVAFGSSTDFVLPNGAIRSPDAGWIAKDRLAAMSREAKRRFLRACPDFVIELRSPTDRLTRLQAKMREWIENGAQLAWLIDPTSRSVSIYRPGRKTEVVRDRREIRAGAPVAGFTLDLTQIWEEL